MKAWKHRSTKQLYDIQSMPGPLPPEFDSSDWELREVSDAEIEAFFYDFDHDKLDRLSALNNEVNEFIYSRYDAGTQSSFLAIYQKSSDQSIKTTLDQVWDWSGVVMSYYYNIKSQMQGARTKGVLDAITWDFDANFGDAGSIMPDPQIKLSSFYGY
jgi:hypothetical protein